MQENIPLSGTRGPVATAIRVQLTLREMSAAELARRMGMPPQTLNSRLTGKTPITVDELIRIAAVLDVKPADLIPAHAPAEAAA